MTAISAPDLREIASRMPQGASVRVAKDEDIDRMVEFWNRFARPTEVERPETMRRWMAMAPDASRLGLIVEADGAIVATATASDGGVFRQPDGSFRGGVRVDPAVRRRGIGSALLDQIEAHGRARGAPKMRGSVRGEEPEGLAFAEARGYREYHRRYQSYLDVQAFDPSGFPDPERTAAVAAVRLASYGQLLAERDDPEPLQREIYDLSNSMLADIPRPDMFTKHHALEARPGRRGLTEVTSPGRAWANLRSREIHGHRRLP